MPFLTALADWCREVTDDVEEWPGWRTRGRSGGVPYVTGRPWCLMYHHTASGDQSLEQYHASGSPNAPVCNLDIKSNGTVVVIAAGPTNTNGKGRDLRTSKGTVPADSMNSYAVGIEFYNNGVGMAWPQRQIDVGFRVIANIQRHLGLAPTDLFTHTQYAPGRKVDPATAAAVAGSWHPRAINGSGSWSDDDLRAENLARSAGTPPGQETIDMGNMAVASWEPGRLDLFVTGEDKKLYHRAYWQEWHGWEDLGGQLIGAPTAVSWGPNRIDVFGTGLDGQVWQIGWQGSDGWSGWHAHGDQP